MKKILYRNILALCALIMANCSSPVADKNAENLERIEIGMTMDKVIEIMDEPERIVIYPFNEDEYEFQYLSPAGYSDQFRIFISRCDSTVVRIGDGL